MYYLMFNCFQIIDTRPKELELPKESGVILNHFGNLDRITRLYTLEGEHNQVHRVFNRLKEIPNYHLEFQDDGETYASVPSGSNWLWKKYIRQLDLNYIQGASL